MLVLGIETSGLEGSVALARDESCLGKRQLNQVGRRHAQSLVLEIQELLSEHALRPRAVSRGPGSFTGLRVGMVCAKTFAYATGCRFIAVDTFAVIAENVPTDVRRLFVIEDAQREDLFAGEYARDESHHWKQTSPIQIISAEEFLRTRSVTDIVTGPGVNKRGLIVLSSNWIKDPVVIRPQASVVAMLGWRNSAQRTEEDSSRDTDFWRASPFYLRLSAAEEKRATAGVIEKPVG